MNLLSNTVVLQVAARASPLSRVQVQEVLQELHRYHPNIEFEITWIVTSGDRDRDTSLRSLEKTDFFTKEIDELILKETCRLGVHSAKDLPDPLPTGLKVICLTRGVDSSDSLVLRDGTTIETLPTNAWIATSSMRREEMVKELRSDFLFKDLRGTIGERLAQLESGLVEGVVVAEAALIRLGLTHLNRVTLPGPTVKGQGQLAVVARVDDKEINDLFEPLDVLRVVE